MPQNDKILASLRAIVDAGGPSKPVRALPRPPVMESNTPIRQMKSSPIYPDEPLAQGNPLDAIFGGGTLESIGDPSNFGPGAAHMPLTKVAKAALPMDEASRMARAAEQGYVHDVYHGTQKNFPAFNDPIRYGGYGSGDFGIHVSSDPLAANRRSNVDLDYSGEALDGATVAPGTHERGGQVLPLKAIMNKTLELPDMGIWKDPVNYIRKYQDALDGHTYGPNFTPLQDDISDPEFLGRLVDEARNLRKVQGMDNSRQMDLWQHKVREMMQDEGYDSIKYRNNVESDGAPSYMLLDPRQLRSRFAKFDPDRTNSRDLMASLAAMIGTGAVASHEKP